MTRQHGNASRGVVLLEVMLAITILGVAALSSLVWVRQVSESLEHRRQATMETLAASDYLDRIALWTRDDLDRHLGFRRNGIWVVRIQRPVTTIYDVAIMDSTGIRAYVTTSLYRPEHRPANE